MARPQKPGLDYFSFDVDFFEDAKVLAISEEFGCKGEIILVRLLCEVYRQGAHIDYTELLKRGVARKAGCSAGLVDEVVKAAVRYEFFDVGLFEQYRVLTSKGIQKRYIKAKENRFSFIDEKYLLVEGFLLENSTKKKVFSKSIPKGKESKVNINIPANAEIFPGAEKISAHGKEPEPEPEPKWVITEFQIPLNDGSEWAVPVDDFEEWKKLYPAVDVPQQLRAMRGWSMANPKKRKTRKGITRFVNGWLAREQDKGGKTTAARQQSPQAPIGYKTCSRDYSREEEGCL